MVAKQPRPHLLDFSPVALRAELERLDEPAYRARQLFSWLHERGELDLARMSNLPLALRQKLTEGFRTSTLKLISQQSSSDGSRKLIWQTPSGNALEAVLLPGFKYGTALCVSVETGCPFACSFCQTGYLGRGERLSAGMILEQLYQAEQLAGVQVDRLVVMGMGEPLTDVNSLGQVVEILTAPEGRGWSPRRITLSTVGLVKPIIKLARTFPRVNLALSLHATTSRQRQDLMPKAESNLAQLAIALHVYRRINAGKISLEYTLIQGLNDRERDLKRLISFARLQLDGAEIAEYDEPLVQEANEAPEPARLQPLPLHVNLIAFNPIPAARQFVPAGEDRLNEWGRALSAAKVPVTVRHSRGQDIGAACGMLGSSAST